MHLYSGRHGRRAASAAAMAALLLPLAACGGSGKSAGDGKSITMWTFKQSHVKPLQDAAARFKDQTGISVTIQAVTPDDAYTAKLQSAAKTNGLPDVLEVHTQGEDFVYGGAGLLTDLSDKVDASWTRGMVPSVRKAGVVTPRLEAASKKPGSAYPGVKAGARYSVPFTIGTFGIVYANKAKLAEAGVSSVPKTWEDLVAAVKATTKKDKRKGGITVGLGTASTGLNWALQPMAFGALGKAGYQGLFGRDSGKTWASPNGQKVLSLYDKLTPYWAPGAQSLSIDAADRSFAQGDAAFDIGGTFTLASLRQFGMKPDEVEAFPIPAPKGGKATDRSLAAFSLTSLAVTTQSKNEAADLKWLRFLAKPDVAGTFAKAATDLPAVDLGDNPVRVVGPTLASLTKVFSSGSQVYDPNDTSFMPAQYPANWEKAGAALVNMSPLKRSSPRETGKQLDTLIKNYWAAGK